MMPNYETNVDDFQKEVDASRRLMSSIRKETEVPTCPNCLRVNRLILVDEGIKCSKDAGGCGTIYPISQIAKLYRKQP